MKLIDTTPPVHWNYPRGNPHPREGLMPTFYTFPWVTEFRNGPGDLDRLGPERFPGDGRERLYTSTAEQQGFEYETR
jgi:hypothetical protein